MKMSNSYQYSFFTVLLSICLLFVVSPEDVWSQDQDNDTHTVRAGDTLFSISRQYDITVGELREWNDVDEESLSVGMRLRVAPPEQQNAVTHTVTSQETLFSISRNYGVTIAEIQDWNNLENTILSVGQELTIYAESGDTNEELPDPEPRPDDEESEPRESIVSPTTAASTYYTVKSGDYLNRIATEHGMTTEELRRLNNLDGDMLSVGQRLIVREFQSTPVVDEEFEESTPQGRFVNYRLESGEDTEALLNRFSMTFEELESLNPGTDISSLNSGQRVTVLLPTSRTFKNPYRKGAGLQDLGDVLVTHYNDAAAATPTTSGELYNPAQLTAAHASMALGSIVYVENPENGRGLYVKVNDRFSGDGIKLSERAFQALNFSSSARAAATIYQEE